MKVLILKNAFVISMILLSLIASAQSTKVLEDLNSAEKLYEQGRPADALQLLNTHNSIFEDKNVRWRARKLSVLCYLAMNDSDSARIQAGKLLSIYPTFVPNHITDPIDFQEIMKGFEPYSSARIGIFAALAPTFYNVRTMNNPANFTKKYTPAVGLGLGIEAEAKMFKRFWLGIKLINQPIEQLITYNYSDWKVEIQESIGAYHIPLLFSYQNESRPTAFSIGTGPYFSFIRNAYYSASFTNSNSNESIVNEKINATDDKESFMYGWCVNGRVWRKALSGFWYAQVQMSGIVSDMNKTNLTDLNGKMLDNFYYLPDDVAPLQLAFQVGYLFSISYKVNDLHSRR